MSEIQSIINEINEEMKHDQIMSQLKQHKNLVTGLLSVCAIGIIVYLSWSERKKKDLEHITNTMLHSLQSPNEKSDLAICELAKSAPAELKPILMLISSGKQLVSGKNSAKDLEALLELSKKSGVHIIWKDLALLIYASWCGLPHTEVIKILEPLAQGKRPFKFSALEQIGIIHNSNGNYKQALSLFKTIINDKECPQSMKKRISMMVNYISNIKGE